jgi:hypothetical protein
MNGAMALVQTHSFYQSFITLSVIRKPDLPMTPLFGGRRERIDDRYTHQTNTQ